MNGTLAPADAKVPTDGMDVTWILHSCRAHTETAVILIGHIPRNGSNSTLIHKVLALIRTEGRILI